MNPVLPPDHVLLAETLAAMDALQQRLFVQQSRIEQCRRLLEQEAESNRRLTDALATHIQRLEAAAQRRQAELERRHPLVIFEARSAGAAG